MRARCHVCKKTHVVEKGTLFCPDCRYILERALPPFWQCLLAILGWSAAFVAFCGVCMLLCGTFHRDIFINIILGAGAFACVGTLGVAVVPLLPTSVARASKRKAILWGCTAAEKAARCMDCGSDLDCKLYEFVICRVMAAETKHYATSRYRFYRHSSSYVRVGSMGGMLCHKCSRRVRWAKLLPGLTMGVIPLPIIGWLFYARPGWVGGIAWVIIVLYVFVALAAALDFFKQLSLGDWHCNITVQSLSRGDVGQKFGGSVVYLCSELPRDVDAVRMLTPAQFESLTRSNPP